MPPQLNERDIADVMHEQGSWVRREVGKDFRDNPRKVLGMDIDLKVLTLDHSLNLLKPLLMPSHSAWDVK